MYSIWQVHADVHELVRCSYEKENVKLFIKFFETSLTVRYIFVNINI